MKFGALVDDCFNTGFVTAKLRSSIKWRPLVGWMMREVVCEIATVMCTVIQLSSFSRE